jgi:aryl-alcohol dehydrogenase-like predicted oxidoreductase
LEGSLRRLRTDYIDLYQVHTFDPWTPLDETLQTLEDFVQQGKVRYVGASNYRAWELMKALGISQRLRVGSFVSHQCSYSLADRTAEREMVPLVRDQGLGLIAYFPLGSGLLTGKYRPGEPAPPGSRGARVSGAFPYQDPGLLALAAEVAAVAEEIHARPAQVALAWLWHHAEVASAIAGARLVGQLQENLGALTVTLSDDARRRLDAASEPFTSREPLGEYRIDEVKEGAS